MRDEKQGKENEELFERFRLRFEWLFDIAEFCEAAKIVEH